MPQVYEVQYQINVNNGPALEAIQQFQTATTKLEQMARRFDAVAQSIGKLNGAFRSINTKPIDVQITTANAERNLQRVITQLESIKSLSKTVLSGAITVSNGAKAGTTVPGMNRLSTRTAASDLRNLHTTIQTTHKSIDGLNKRYIHPKANVGTALKSLDKLIAKINEVKGMGNITVTASAAGAARTVRGSARGVASTPVTITPKPRTTPKRVFPTWRGVTGPIYAGTGATFAGEMVKGMGVAYGLSAIMSGVSNVFRDASNFENISQTTKNILGISEKGETFEGDFQRMSKLIRDVGMETKFTAPQVASAGKFLAMAGYRTQDIEQSIRPIANLALIGDTDLGETADVVTNMMTSYNIAPNRMNRTADMLATTFTQSNVTLMDLAESFKYAGTVAHQSGLEFATTAAAIGVLGDAGIKASHAGTTLRMMLMNMQKPTKKQKAAWEALGVTPKDSSGNLKDFGTLLQELNAAKSKFSQGNFASLFFQAFRITAAPGVMALVNNADKVQRIESMNKYDSFGVAEEQADAKKNTIQGLWYQMTSAFTESGMRGFESMQSVIRDFLNRTIQLMKSDEFASGLRGAMSLFLKVLENIVDVFKFVIGLWNSLGTWWQDSLAWAIKWQMHLGIILAIWKSIWSTGMMIVKPLSSILILFSKIIVPMREMVVLSRLLGAGRLSSIGAGIAEGWAAIRGTSTLRGAATVGRGAIAGSELGVIGNGLKALGGFLFTNPVGWAVMAGTAILGIGIATYKAHQSTLQAVDSVNKWGESYRKLNIDQRKITTQQEWVSTNMDILQSKLHDEKQKIDLLTESYNKYWAARRGEKPQDDTTPFKDTDAGKDWKTDLENINKAFTSREDIDLFGQTLLTQLGGSIMEHQNWDANGKNFYTYTIETPWGTIPRAPSDSRSNMLSQYDVVQLYLAKLAATPGANPLVEKYKDRANELLAGTNSVQDFDTQMNYLKTNAMPTANELNTWYNIDGALPWTFNDIQSQSTSVQVTRAFQESTNEMWTTYYRKILEDIEKEGTTDTANVQQFLFQRLTDRIFDISLGTFGTPEWVKNINDMYHHPEKYGLQVNSEEFAKGVSETFSELLGLYSQVNDKVKGVIAPYLYENIWQLPFDGKLSLTGGIKPAPSNITDTMTVDGVKYHAQWHFRKSQWIWADKNGKPYAPKDPSKDNWTPSSTNNPGNALHNGADQSEYKSHYNQSSAPKQVIVRIENLMRVDKQTIDMTDDRQVAAVNSIKQELATALLDVVQDFNANII